jgi:hypothetical protein
MQHGIGELMGFKAGNNQWFILFRVAGKDGKWRTSQVNNLLDNIGLVATAYMDNPKIIGFAHNDMENHEIVKLIKQAQGSSDGFHWASDSTASKVFKKLAANLSVPIMASQGSHRERKAPERLKMTEEPKKPRRKGPSAEEIQAKRQRLQPVEQHYETESEEEVVVSQPSDEHVSMLQEAIQKATADAQPAVVASPPVVAAPSAEAQPAVAAPPPVVQAVYMPNFSAVYSEAEKSAEIKRLEAHLADKDAEIKRLEEVFRLHLAEKDKTLKAALAAVQAFSNP